VFFVRLFIGMSAGLLQSFKLNATSLKLSVIIGPIVGKNQITFGGDSVPCRYEFLITFSDPSALPNNRAF